MVKDVYIMCVSSIKLMVTGWLQVYLFQAFFKGAFDTKLLSFQELLKLNLVNKATCCSLSKEETVLIIAVSFTLPPNFCENKSKFI